MNNNNNNTKLLLPEYPLIILPSLAKKIGLNEAIIIQQMHYWLIGSSNMHNGKKWVYNSYSEWQKQFPFWGESTIKRTILKLEKQGLILTGNFNKLKIDRTKWYTIDYDNPLIQQDTSIGSDCPHQNSNLNSPLPLTSSEITSEITGDQKVNKLESNFVNNKFKDDHENIDNGTTQTDSSFIPLDGDIKKKEEDIIIQKEEIEPNNIDNNKNIEDKPTLLEGVFQKRMDPEELKRRQAKLDKIQVNTNLEIDLDKDKNNIWGFGNSQKYQITPEILAMERRNSIVFGNNKE